VPSETRASGFGVGAHLHPGAAQAGRVEVAGDADAVERLQAARVHDDRPRLGGGRGQLVDDAHGHAVPG